MNAMPNALELYCYQKGKKIVLKTSVCILVNSYISIVDRMGLRVSREIYAA